MLDMCELNSRGADFNIPSLKSLPEQFLVIDAICSNVTIRPASLAGSLSCDCLAFVTNISLRLGLILSANMRGADGSRSIILYIFCNISDRSSLSFISSSNAGSIFFSITDLGNDGKTLLRPLMNCAFSLGVLAGNASRKRMVDTRMLSKYSLCWNSRAVMRCAGLRATSRGRTWVVRSLGIGRDERKPLDGEGTVDEDEKSRLYVERLPWHSSGERCGEL